MKKAPFEEQYSARRRNSVLLPLLSVLYYRNVSGNPSTINRQHETGTSKVFLATKMLRHNRDTAIANGWILVFIVVSYTFILTVKKSKQFMYTMEFFIYQPPLSDIYQEN